MLNPQHASIEHRHHTTTIYALRIPTVPWTQVQLGGKGPSPLALTHSALAPSEDLLSTLVPWTMHAASFFPYRDGTFSLSASQDGKTCILRTRTMLLINFQIIYGLENWFQFGDFFSIFQSEAALDIQRSKKTFCLKLRRYSNSEENQRINVSWIWPPEQKTWPLKL